MGKRAKASGTEGIDAASIALRAKAREAGPEAIEVLLRLCRNSKSESVQLAAIKELLDRGFGRPAQSDQAGAAIAHLVIDDGYKS